VELLALIVASFTLPAVVGALALGLVGWTTLGWFGGIVGILAGYLAGMIYVRRFGGAPMSSYAKGWLSLVLFIGGLTALAIATR
jgi:hypothetical protein